MQPIRHTIAIEPVRKPVAVAGPRNLALAASSALATRRGPIVPVTVRVRDSLVLRVVARKTTPGNVHDEHRAR